MFLHYSVCIALCTNKPASISRRLTIDTATLVKIYSLHCGTGSNMSFYTSY